MHRALISIFLFTAILLALTLTASATSLPSPPSNATVFSNIDDSSSWTWCHNPSCAGGSGQGTYWMARNQTSPSRDGASTEFYNSGVWANALWYHKVGAHDSLHHFLWDLYFYVDSNSQHSAQALEFDVFQFVGGYNYMMGTQCDYGYGVWDTWDTYNGRWVRSSIPCHKFSAGTWHHLQWYMTDNTSTHKYTFVTMAVDGNVIPVNITRTARYNGWSHNLGQQFQLDVNSTGQGYHEWVDRVKLTAW